MANPGFPQFRCCGVRIDALSYEAAVDAVMDLAERQGGAAVHLCNAYTLSLAESDPKYRDRLNDSELNLPDGVPVVWAGRVQRTQISGPVRGKDLFEGVVDSGRARGLRHMLYGSSAEVVAAAEAALRTKYPAAEIVASEAPPFRPLSNVERDELVARLESSRPHLVWVGLGTPKQDDFAEDMKSRYPATYVAVGAAFDFIAGSKKEAPTWIRGTGFEWVYRLLSEPRRLWRRYLIGNAIFLRGVAGDRRRAR